MNYNPIQLGDRIRIVREGMGLSQDAFAEQIGIGRVHLAKIETGAKGFSLDLLIDIAAYAKVSLDYLVFGRNVHEYIEDTLKNVIDSLSKLRAEIKL